MANKDSPPSLEDSMGFFDFLSGSTSYSTLPGTGWGLRQEKDLLSLLQAYATGVPGSGPQAQAMLGALNARTGQAYGNAQQQLLATLTPGSPGYANAGDALGRFQAAKAAGQSAAYAQGLEADQAQRLQTLYGQLLPAFSRYLSDRRDSTVATNHPGLGQALGTAAQIYGMSQGMAVPNSSPQAPSSAALGSNYTPGMPAGQNPDSGGWQYVPEQGWVPRGSNGGGGQDPSFYGGYVGGGSEGFGGGF